VGQSLIQSVACFHFLKRFVELFALHFQTQLLHLKVIADLEHKRERSLEPREIEPGPSIFLQFLGFIKHRDLSFNTVGHLKFSAKLDKSRQPNPVHLRNLLSSFKRDRAFTLR
jgi:hypothetical protein